MKEKILEIKDLHIHYKTDYELVKALNGIDFEIYKGESLGLVGETGAGKTTTAMSVMKLIPQPPGLYINGQILFEGKDLMRASEKDMRELRGNEISMIFQDPMTALNPRMTIIEQIAEVISFHERISKEKAKKKANKMLEIVGIDPARSGEYPYQFSGGMKQRVIIAIALACQPKLILADEPTTALDVTVQAQILKLIKQLRDEFDTSILMITHDLGVVAQTCERVGVLYAGEIVEYGTLDDVYNNTKHYYTKGLFLSIPDIYTAQTRLEPIAGEITDPSNLPMGCKFHPRCSRCEDKCKKEHPKMTGDSHKYRCHFPL